VELVKEVRWKTLKLLETVDAQKVVETETIAGTEGHR
jgi:hypothetical protein